MESKHTPGPWRYSELGSEGAMIYPDYGDIRERGRAICRVDMRDTLTDFANARLIAAAPELLEAVEAASDYFHDFTESDQEETDLAKLMRAAIAKAKGE